MRDRISVHDLDFADVPAGMVFGPLPCPTADELRGALRRIAHRYPDNRLFLAVERTRSGARWVRRSDAQLDQLCVDMVEDAPAGTDDTDALLRRVASPPGAGLLVQYVVSRRYIASTRSHLLGDAAFGPITPMVVRVALGDAVPHLQTEPVHHLPLTRALTSYFGRDLRRLGAALATPRPRPRRTADSVTVPPDWTVTSIGRTATADAVRAVREWRDACCPSASVASTWMAAIRGAFDDAGLRLATPGLHVLVNARRYLPAGASVSSNFAASFYVEPGDPRDPSSVEAIVRRNLDSGRPLLAMVATSLKTPWRSRRHPVRRPMRADAAPTLTVSYLGRWAAFEPLPVVPSEVVQYSAVRPDGPDGLTVLCSGGHGRMSLSACFCDAVVPRARVVDALERLVDDPVAHLSVPTVAVGASSRSAR